MSQLSSEDFSKFIEVRFELYYKKTIGTCNTANHWIWEYAAKTYRCYHCLFLNPCVWVRACECSCLSGPEEGARSTGARVTGGRTAWPECGELNWAPLQKQ